MPEAERTFFRFCLFHSRTHLVENSGVLHIYYANKTFKHWKKRWLHLQDQQLAIYQGKEMYSVYLSTDVAAAAAAVYQCKTEK